jgi:hypothetical protein
LLSSWLHPLKGWSLLKTRGGSHIDWLNAARRKDWHYWRRYRDYQESKLSDVVVDGLDESTGDILGLLEDPLRADPWDRRGLVVGHVQSGKTSNYTGLINKAADAGYKIIIVLAGLHNNLRSQTQIRLEEGFLGYETTQGGDPGASIGVAAFGEDLKTNSATTRAENGDFSQAIAKHFNGISPEERPWVFVVKKQKNGTDRAAQVDSEEGGRHAPPAPLFAPAPAPDPGRQGLAARHQAAAAGHRRRGGQRVGGHRRAAIQRGRHTG